MKVAASPAQAPLRMPSALKTENTAPAAAAQQDGFSPVKVLAGGVLTFMGRRIPTTFPDFTQERRSEISGKVKPGDVLLSADMAFPGWGRMEFWTVRSHYTHAAFVGSDKHVYEAVGNGVQRVTLDSFLEGRIKVSVFRPGLSTEDTKKATDYCSDQIGKAYDSVFKTNGDEEFYCSELVAKALAKTDKNPEVPMSKLMGKDFIAPDAFRYLPGVEVVHDEKSNYFKNKLGYWPLATSAAAGAAAGAAIGGLSGAAIGGVAGFVGSVLIGNKIQTGHFSPGLAEMREGKH